MSKPKALESLDDKALEALAAAATEGSKPTLFIVRAGKRLYWPADPKIFPMPGGDTANGWAARLRRHPFVRGEAGYVVDPSAPHEAHFLRGQGHKLDPVSGMGRRAPKRADEIDDPAVLAWIDRQAAAAPPQAAPEGSDDTEGGGDAGGPQGGSQEPSGGAGEVPGVEGSLFRPLEGPAGPWAGVYREAETDAVTHLLPSAEGAQPVAFADVPEEERPEGL